MLEYDNKQCLEDIVKNMKASGKTKVRLEDIEGCLPTDLRCRHLTALCLMKQMFEYKILAKNETGEGYPFLSDDMRESGRSNLRCLDKIILMFVVEEISFDFLANEISHQEIPSCFSNRCEHGLKQTEPITSAHERLYFSLQRLIYNDWVIESTPWHFVLNEEKIDFDTVLGMVREQAAICQSFRRWLEKDYSILFEDEDDW